jgi:hypothetical protein
MLIASDVTHEKFIHHFDRDRDAPASVRLHEYRSIRRLAVSHSDRERHGRPQLTLTNGYVDEHRCSVAHGHRDFITDRDRDSRRHGDRGRHRNSGS